MKYPEINEVYRVYLEHPVVSTDTRNIISGSIFVALKGSNFNANEFAKEAIAKGASYAIIDEEKYYSDKCILVPDVLIALQALANFHRNRFDIPVIGITGTNGKTTTKELTACVLSKRYNTLFTQGNFNNHIGVPLTLLNLTKEHEMAVIEMGANHVGEIEQLCNIAEPGYGIITNIGKAHLEGFGGYEGVIKAKSELYKYIRLKEGKLFVNADDELLMNLSSETQRITYGTSGISTIRGFQDKKSFLAKGEIVLDGKQISIGSLLAGSYNFYNILAAAAVGFHFNVKPEEIKAAIEEYIPSNNRSQIVKKGTNTIWMDAYNANPSSMKSAIENFAGMDDGVEHIQPQQKILILGDMFELGAESRQEHQELADWISSRYNWGGVYLLGKEFCAVHSTGQKFGSTEDFMKWLSEHALANKTILLKGSRGMKMEKILEVIS